MHRIDENNGVVRTVHRTHIAEWQCATDFNFKEFFWEEIFFILMVGNMSL